MALKQYSNSFADPRNAVKLSQGIDCGCDDASDCQASYTYVYSNSGDTLTTTDVSFLLSGDGIVLVTGVDITVQDRSGNSVNTAGDATAPIVVNTATLTATDESYRIDYVITTDNGCISTVTIFIDPTKDSSGSPDPYNAIR
jgi:hypothetical protein